MEINKMLALSTAHVSQETASLLDEGKGGVVSYMKEGHGWFVYAGFLGDYAPPELRACVEYAVKHDCEWIMFDGDVEPLDELKQFEW